MLSKVVINWAALGIALTSATQLRIAGLPIGPGEMLLAFWMAFVGVCLLRGVRFNRSDTFRVFSIYWLISAILLLVGSLVATNLRVETRLAQHDAQAFGFVAVLTCLLCIRLGNILHDEYHLRLARAAFFTISAMSLLLLAASLVTPELGPISLWYHGVRFRGWSENPNQFALFMLPMPLLGWYLLQRAPGLGYKVFLAVGIITCATAGLATQSDALHVAWAGAAGVIAAWLWCRLIVRGRGNFLHMAISHFVVPVIVLTLLVGLGHQIVSEFEDIAGQVYQKGDRGQIGMVLLWNGIKAISHSPVVGLGPGAYSGYFAPFEDMEAHNTLIDWGMSTGVLGMTLYLGLVFWCFWRAVRTGSPALLGVLTIMIIDSLFGNSLRQPIFWLMLVLVVSLAEKPVRQIGSSVRLSNQGMTGVPEALPER